MRERPDVGGSQPLLFAGLAWAWGVGGWAEKACVDGVAMAGELPYQKKTGQQKSNRLAGAGNDT